VRVYASLSSDLLDGSERKPAFPGNALRLQLIGARSEAENLANLAVSIAMLRRHGRPGA
jgi:hypothetical protein